MCGYKMLQHDERGYVTRCSRCRHLHVAFGTTVLAFTTDQFYEFAQQIEGYREMHRHTSCPEEKNIQVPTLLRTVMLLYSYRELDALYSLLADARKKLDHEQLVAFHEN